MGLQESRPPLAIPPNPRESLLHTAQDNLANNVWLQTASQGLYELPVLRATPSPSSTGATRGEVTPIQNSLPLVPLESEGLSLFQVEGPQMSDDRKRSQPPPQSQPPRQIHTSQPNNPPRQSTQLAYTQPTYYTPPFNAQSFQDHYSQPPSTPYTVPYSTPQTPPGGVMYSQTGPFIAQYTSAVQHPSQVVQPHPYGLPQSFTSHQPHPPSPDTGLYHQPIIGMPFSSGSSGSPAQQIYTYQQQPSPDTYDQLHMGMDHRVPPRMVAAYAESSPPNESSRTSQASPSNVHAAEVSPAHFSNTRTSPPYPYSPQPFQQQQTPSVYHTQYVGPYQRPFYPQSSSEDHKGTWWYLPSAADANTSGLYRGYDTSGYPLQQPAVPSPADTYPSFSPRNVIPDLQVSSPHPRPVSSSDVTTSMNTLSLGSPITARREVSETHTGSFRPKSSQHRKPYHPNPPANRSAWVMWVGNVPSDSSNEELWQFFNQQIPVEENEQRDMWPTSQPGAVSSVFLIARSNCAFVNFESEVHLLNAVRYFNGRSLRPHDPRCMKLVCRIRKPDDDLKAGVGGQRGMGMHVRHIKEQKQKAKDTNDESREETGADRSASPTSQANRSISSDLSHSSGADDKGPLHHSSSSGSYASTTSSFLLKYFPKRYFILKSLNEADLHLSVERGLWATQAHNEPVLDQAYHTSKEVYLVFSANKSGEFFGYARMSGPIRPGERSVSWTSRADAPTEPQSHSHPQKSAQGGEESATTRVEEPPASFLLSPSEHRVASSPGMLTPMEEQRLKSLEASPGTPSASQDIRGHSPNILAGPYNTAPPEMDQPHDKLSFKANTAKHGTDPRTAQTIDHIDVNTMMMKSLSSPHQIAVEQEQIGTSSREQVLDDHGVLHKDTLVSTKEKRERSDELAKQHPAAAEEKDANTESWGTPFSIEWIKIEKLSFHRTRHIRNPWNHDREVKVSRDGTELEPTIGAALLSEWDKLHLSSPTEDNKPPSPQLLSHAND